MYTLVQLLIQRGKKLYEPVIVDVIEWSTERKGVPGQLTFTVLKDETISFTEGNAVRLKVDDTNIFYGFVFSKQRDKDGTIKITAYDQLRYFKNKDTYMYKNKTASEVIKLLSSDFQLNVGEIEDTKYKIASRLEENTTLFDIVLNALDLTLQNKKEMFVLYDDFGKLTLKNISSMKVEILIDEETGENFDYTSSIDENTYNKVKLTYDNDKTGKREVYIAKDSSHINSWGVLQYFDTLQENENGKEKANALLNLYNTKTRKLSIKNAFGDIRVRAGCMVYVRLYLGDLTVNSWMLVEKCKHSFGESEHFMDLTLRGGEFIA